MKLSRREMLLVGLGLVAHGCASATGPASRSVGDGYARRVGLPQTTWPDAISQPVPVATYVRAPAPRLQPVAPPPHPAAPPPPTLDVIDRSRWASHGPNPAKLNPMGGINRITVHHEGWKPVWFDDFATTAERLDHIRSTHVGTRHWADIGYHYIIDRAGRIWEGRDLRYQGAHVAECNEHNIGVMLLGNFDKQSPSDAQMGTLRNALRVLMKRHGVGVNRVYTHQELKPTACPGRALQPRVVSLRNNGYLA